MKIALLGARGTAELAARLEARGHEVVIYRRPQFVCTLFAAIHAARVTRPDIAVFFAVAGSPLCLITRIASIPTVIHLDSGSESGRRSRGRLDDACQRVAAWGAPRFANRAITEPRFSCNADIDRYEQLLEAVRIAGGPGRLPHHLLDLDLDLDLDAGAVQAATTGAVER